MKGGVKQMTTARERYEQKTKVLTFRIDKEQYQKLEKVKVKTGLSNADLVKLGAKIASEEVEAKLSQISGLEDRLRELEASLTQEQENLDEFLSIEKVKRLKELEGRIEAFKLFSQRLSIDEVSFRLGISQTTVFHYHEEWAEARKDKRALRRELLKLCMKKHIDYLKSSRNWAQLSNKPSPQRIMELEKQIADCQRLLAHPARITKEDREYLLVEYLDDVLPRKRVRP
jgi:hypothetical protein